MLAPIFDIPFDSDKDWKVWMLDHSLQHDSIYVSLVTKGKTIIKLPLTEAKDPNDKDWMNNHQLEHEAIYAVLGLAGMPDLASSDLTKQDQWQAWQELHQDVHALINTTLGI